MILLNYRNNFYRFFMYISVVLVVLFVIVNVIYTEPLKIKSSLINSTISYEDEITYIDVHYPRFKNDKIDKIISEYIFDYVKRFKSFDLIKKELSINYEIYYINEYINVVFNINNSIDKTKYKNLIFNLDSKSLSYITNLYEKEFLESKINELSYYKYSEEIYNLIINSNINNHTYIINDNKIIVYFYDINFDDIDYTPYIEISLNENVSNEVKPNNYKYNKFIVFTFDDGPSKYTSELLKTLELNNSTATFFMLGNRMKYNEDIVLDVYNSKNEIASHTYSHKNLSTLPLNEIENEINSTEIIYNEITNDNLKYIRPPYGDYNDNVLSFGYPLILWNIDSKDWLYKDSNKIYNEVIKNACDGCIVLMHDTYIESIDAVKKLIPALNNLDYNVVSIENLLKEKHYNLKNGEAIGKIN